MLDPHHWRNAGHAHLFTGTGHEAPADAGSRRHMERQLQQAQYAEAESTLVGGVLGPRVHDLAEELLTCESHFDATRLVDSLAFI